MSLITEKQALKIAHSLVSGEKDRESYGFSALKETESILYKLLETKEVEEELFRKNN